MTRALLIDEADRSELKPYVRLSINGDLPLSLNQEECGVGGAA